MSLLGMILGMGQGAGNPQRTFQDGTAPGLPDFGSINPDQNQMKDFNPFDILRDKIGRQFSGGGGMVPNMAAPAPPQESPFSRLPFMNDQQMERAPEFISGGSGVDQVSGNPQQDALAEQGFAPDSVQAQAYAGLKQPAGAQSTTTTKASTPKVQNAPTPVPEVAHTPTSDLRRQSISRIESGSANGNYRALGERTRTGDRAYGRYQVMGNNIGPWTQQVLGRRLTPQEFLANPAAQDKVFDEIFGEAVQRYGEAGAASVWFTGSPTPSGKQDPGGTVDHDYVARYMHGLNMPMSAVNNQRPGTGDGSVMEAMQPGVNSAISGGAGGSDQMMAVDRSLPGEQAAKNGAQPEQQAPTAEQLDQVRQMSLKERLALLQQFMQLGGFKPGEGSIG